VKELLVVGFGGFIGAISRYGLSGYMDKTFGKGFPSGTLVVNVLGCFLIGLLMTLVEDQKFTNKTLQLLIVTGLLGSLTTFSTFGHQSLDLLRKGSFSLAFLNVICNLGVGLFAVSLGRFLVRLFN
jgi:fluoride exporter